MTRVLVVDDEAPARRLVRDALARSGLAAEVVGECANGPEAVRFLTERAVDLVVLDVQMPGLDGFEVLAALAERGVAAPAVVFSTAFDRFAVRAFEVAAVDYLLKPFTQARFEQALGRALAAGADAPGRLAEAVGPRYAERLLVEDGGVFVPVAVADVLWAEAAGDYTTLHTHGRTFLASQGIGALADRLDPARFARVHRSTVVALDALRALERDNSGGFVARLADGAVVRVSRTYADTIRRMMA